MKHIAVVHLLTFVVLPLCCRNVPGTVYYKLFNDKRQAEKTIQVENSERLKQAVHILDQLDLSGYNRYGTGQGCSEDASVTISMTVVTISRDHLAKYSPMYLTQVVANLLVLIKNYESTSRHLHINLSICNVDKHPANHTEAVSLSRFVPMLTRHRDVNDVHLYNNKETHKRDYLYCLRQMELHDSDYVNIIEDDAVPLPDMIGVLEYIINGYLTTSPDGGKPGVTSHRLERTAFVKFYHPERLLGFLNIDSERLPELCGFSSCIATIAVMVYYITTSQARRGINIRELWVVFFIYGVIFCLCVGRSNMITFRRLFSPYLYYVTRSPSCCAPSILYNRQHLSRIISMLEDVECNKTYSWDTALDDIVYREDLTSYLVQPNVFKHVGMYSANQNRKISPYMIK